MGSALLEREVWNLLREGRLCTTEKGRLGLGPVSCLEGDEVWLLAGARTPVLLRRVEGREYKLVGEIFVPEVDVVKALRCLKEGEVQSVVLF